MSSERRSLTQSAAEIKLRYNLDHQLPLELPAGPGPLLLGVPGVTQRPTRDSLCSYASVRDLSAHPVHKYNHLDLNKVSRIRQKHPCVQCLLL